jgi:cytochrome P450
MKKLDSVLRESQRMNGALLGPFISLHSHRITSNPPPPLATGIRKAMVPYTFSDGTYVPKGTLMVTPAHAIHRDASIYKNPLEFDGFRFSRIREQPGQEAKHQLVATSNEYVVFGTGKHAW